MANSCAILVIQSKNSTSLEPLLNNPVQMKALFNGAGAEGDILQIDRYTSMPGQRNILHIDRAENAKNITLVAGYYPFPEDKHIARFTIPITLSKSGFWNREWVAKLAPLNAKVILGRMSIIAHQNDENALKEIQ